jgi:hypothetical protein
MRFTILTALKQKDNCKGIEEINDWKADCKNFKRWVPVCWNPYTYLLIYLLTYWAEPFMRSCQLWNYSKNSQHFMESECSLPCLQEPSTGHYPEPDRFSPYHPNYLRSTLILSTHIHFCLPSGHFSSAFPVNILYVFLLSPVLYMPYPSHPPWLNRSTSYEAPHYAVFSISSHFISLGFSAPCFQTPSLYFTPLITEPNFCTHTELQAKL